MISPPGAKTKSGLALRVARRFGRKIARVGYTSGGLWTRVYPFATFPRHNCREAGFAEVARRERACLGAGRFAPWAIAVLGFQKGNRRVVRVLATIGARGLRGVEEAKPGSAEEDSRVGRERQQELRSGKRDAFAASGFDAVYSAYRAPIMRYFHRLTRDRALCEELAQETFLRVDRGLALFEGRSNLATWIYRIPTSVYVDLVRKRAGSPPPAESWDNGAEPVAADESVSVADPKLPDKLLERSEMGECIRGFVDGLPPDYRAAIVLRDLEGFKNAEIAEVLGCSLETVKIRIQRARRKLRALLSENCGFYYDEGDVLSCDRRQPRGGEKS